MQQKGKKRFFNRYPKLTATLFGMMVGVILLGGGEFFLKKSGFECGVARQTHLWKLDSLVVKNDYETDTNGIMSVSKVKKVWVEQQIATKTPFLPITSDTVPDLPIFETANDFIALQAAEDKNTSEFGRFMAEVKNKPNPDSVDLALLQYLQKPVNTAGFRSIEFKNYTTSKTKVLLLGDSYTWGRSAHPVTNSFADLLLANKLCVYNTGIVGADPAQYEAIARLWIPVLKPDVVCVNYYLGNDNLFYPRQPLANQPPWYVTNAGWLNAFPAGFYVSPAVALQFAQANGSIPVENGAFNRFCSKTRIGTQLWFLLAKTGVLNPYGKQVTQLLHQNRSIKKQRYSVSIQYLRRIEKICKDNNSKFILSVIPMYTEVNPDETLLSKLLFPEMPFYMPRNLTTADYVATPADGHFNNSGHSKYTAHLLELINRLRQ